jgi:hypothetical protein
MRRSRYKTINVRVSMADSSKLPDKMTDTGILLRDDPSSMATQNASNNIKKGTSSNIVIIDIVESITSHPESPWIVATSNIKSVSIIVEAAVVIDGDEFETKQSQVCGEVQCCLIGILI